MELRTQSSDHPTLAGAHNTRRRSSTLGVLGKDSFEQYRWRCIFSPDRARGTLKAFATLSINVLYARDLIGVKSHNLGAEASSDPYFEIYVDDKLMYRSNYVYNTIHPNFKSEPQLISIYHPKSIVRLQIVDAQTGIARYISADEILGFVEFAVADLPIERSVSGLFELRFRTMLQGRGPDRVKMHVKMRDEDRSIFLPTDDTIGDLGDSLLPPPRKEFEDIKDDPLVTVALRKKKRRPGLLTSCCAPHPPTQTRLNEATGTMEAVPEEEVDCHLNGGQVYLDLYLLTTRENEFFASFLPGPSFSNYPPPFVRRTDLPRVDLQEMVDTYTYVKQKLFDQGLLCVADFLHYVFTWQNLWLSLFNLAMALIIAIWPERLFMVLPGVVSVYMLLLHSREFRWKVTMNALTCPLSDEGYKQIAAMDNTKAAWDWVKRVVNSNHGTINNEEKFQLFAALSIRDGQPVLPSYSALLQELKIAAKEPSPWIKFPETQGISEGTPVVILQDTVDATTIDGYANYAQEEHGVVIKVNEDSTYMVSSELTKTTKLVREGRLKKRMKAPNIPQWLIPVGLENLLRTLHVVIYALRDNAVPGALKLRAILTWENFGVALGITIVGFVLSGVLILLHIIGLHEDRIYHIIQISIGVFLAIIVFVIPSWWFQRCVTILNAIRFRMRHVRTYSYHKWAFFREMHPGLYPDHATGAINEEATALLQAHKGPAYTGKPGWCA